MNSPDEKLPSFVHGLATHPQPVFGTGIRLLATYAFTGNIQLRFRPQSNGPHHVIVACSSHRQTVMAFMLSRCLYLINLALAKGREALGVFITAMQAEMRSRCQEPSPDSEDHSHHNTRRGYTYHGTLRPTGQYQMSGRVLVRRYMLHVSDVTNVGAKKSHTLYINTIVPSRIGLHRGLDIHRAQPIADRRPFSQRPHDDKSQPYSCPPSYPSHPSR
jgi:hypothetical protein